MKITKRERDVGVAAMQLAGFLIIKQDVAKEQGDTELVAEIGKTLDNAGVKRDALPSGAISFSICEVFKGAVFPPKKEDPTHGG